MSAEPKPSASSSAVVSELRRLIALGRDQGTITVDEVLVALGSPDPTPAFIEAITELLDGHGITVDPEEPAAEAPSSARAAVPPAATAAPAPSVARASAPRRRPLAEPASGDTGRGAADPVRMYLREIGRVPLLDSCGEVALAQRIEHGARAALRLEEADRGEVVLDADERVRLALEQADGAEAKRSLIQANLRLVVSIAKRYAGRGMLLLDLIQEGNLGLMRAVDKFDHAKGFKFSTYATWWVRQAITRAIADQARTIRIPVHMVETINRVMRTQREMLQALEREPTVEEVAMATAMTAERVREIYRISQDPLSLDSPVGEEDDTNLGDFIEDQRALVPADVAIRELLGEAVEEALTELDERERAIVRLRFGLDGQGQARTLEEVGREFGVTRERIRQIESKTLAKLRHPQRSQKLRDYLEP